MSEWRQLTDLHTEIESAGEKGVTVRVFLSPFDVPQAVRGYYDQKDHVFRIEFRYLADEPEERFQRAPHQRLALVLGKNSGRILRIDIAVDALRVERVQLEMAVLTLVEQAIDNLEKTRPEPERKKYDVTREAIQSQRKELFRELVPA